MADPHDVDILDADTLLELEDLCRVCGVDVAWIEEMTAYGVVAPGAGARYTAIAIARLRKARRLEQDFALNASGVALVLDLLDEIEHLRARLR